MCLMCFVGDLIFVEGVLYFTCVCMCVCVCVCVCVCY